jgi:hypothetical protein
LVAQAVLGYLEVMEVLEVLEAMAVAVGVVMALTLIAVRA